MKSWIHGRGETTSRGRGGGGQGGGGGGGGGGLLLSVGRLSFQQHSRVSQEQVVAAAVNGVVVVVVTVIIITVAGTVTLRQKSQTKHRISTSYSTLTPGSLSSLWSHTARCQEGYLFHCKSSVADAARPADLNSESGAGIPQSVVR